MFLPLFLIHKYFLAPFEGFFFNLETLILTTVLPSFIPQKQALELPLYITIPSIKKLFHQAITMHIHLTGA